MGAHARRVVPNGPEFAQLICPHCGAVPLSYQDYLDQLRVTTARWHCPRCGRTSNFDDEYYDRKHLKE